MRVSPNLFGGVLEPFTERAERGRLRCVLCDVLIDQFGQGGHLLSPDGGEVPAPKREDLIHLAVEPAQPRPGGVIAGLQPVPGNPKIAGSSPSFLFAP
jgi:hypothetical protein